MVARSGGLESAARSGLESTARSLPRRPSVPASLMWCIIVSLLPFSIFKLFPLRLETVGMKETEAATDMVDWRVLLDKAVGDDYVYGTGVPHS